MGLVNQVAQALDDSVTQEVTNHLFQVGITIPLNIYTVCPGSSDPPEKIFNIFASENEVYTIY